MTANITAVDRPNSNRPLMSSGGPVRSAGLFRFFRGDTPYSRRNRQNRQKPTKPTKRRKAHKTDKTDETEESRQNGTIPPAGRRRGAKWVEHANPLACQTLTALDEPRPIWPPAATRGGRDDGDSSWPTTAVAGACGTRYNAATRMTPLGGRKAGDGGQEKEQAGRTACPAGITDGGSTACTHDP
jgi:hypothetical protein